MPRLGILLAALVLLPILAATTATTARACPQPPPGQRCSKYDFMIEAQYTKMYMRTQRAVLAPRVKGARVLRMLTTSTWTAHGAAPVPMLALYDAASPPATTDDLRQNVLVRSVAWQGDHYAVAINGGNYAVQRCRDDRGLLTTCLVFTGLLN